MRARPACNPETLPASLAFSSSPSNLFQRSSSTIHRSVRWWWLTKPRMPRASGLRWRRGAPATRFSRKSRPRTARLRTDSVLGSRDQPGQPGIHVHLHRLDHESPGCACGSRELGTGQFLDQQNPFGRIGRSSPGWNRFHCPYRHAGDQAVGHTSSTPTAAG